MRNGARRARLGTTTAEGIGVRVRVGGAWGFAATRDTSRAGAERALAPRARDRRGPARRARRGRARPSRPRAGTGRTRPSSTRTASRSRRSSALLVAAEEALRGDPRLVRTDAGCTRDADGPGVRLDRGRRVHAGAHECGGRARRDRGRRRRAADPLVPERPRRPHRAGRLGARPRARPRRQRAARRRRGGRAADRAAVPDRAARRSSCTPSSSRCRSTSRSATRSSSTASCSARPPTRGRAGCSPRDLGVAALRLRAADDHRRRDAAGRARDVRLGRRGHGGAARRRSSTGGVLRARAERPRVGRRGRPRASAGCARADGFDRQPIVRMTNVSIEPGDAGSLADLLADTGEGLLPRDEPLVVDRRPPAALPVRHRGRARDPGRRARPAVRNPVYAGTHAARSGRRSTPSARRPSGRCGA